MFKCIRRVAVTKPSNMGNNIYRFTLVAVKFKVNKNRQWNKEKRYHERLLLYTSDRYRFEVGKTYSFDGLGIKKGT
jgi:hypothetical protein